MKYYFIFIFSVILLITNCKYNSKGKRNKSGKEWYKDYLKTDHWRDARSRALKRAGYKCQLCGCRGNLQVHHNNYKNIWHEKDGDLIVLCWKCHKKIHNK